MTTKKSKSIKYHTASTSWHEDGEQLIFLVGNLTRTRIVGKREKQYKWVVYLEWRRPGCVIYSSAFLCAGFIADVNCFKCANT